MTELERLNHQLHTTFVGGAWHGPSVLEALTGVTAIAAAERPIPGAHTIWEIVLHLGGTYGLVLRRLRGDTRQLSPAEDWPPVTDTSIDAWTRAVAELTMRNEELRTAVAAFPADRLDEPLVPDPPYTAHTQFIGITQHNLYHAGQALLLRRASTKR